MSGQSRSPAHPRRAQAEPPVPPMAYWNTTDAQEVARRQQRAREETFEIKNLNPRHPVFSNFEIHSGSGLSYHIEIRDVATRQFSCQCVDFRINGLGTCKHVEAVLNHLDGRFKRLFAAAVKSPSPRLDLVPDEARGTLRIEGSSTERQRLPKVVGGWFDPAVSGFDLAPGDIISMSFLFRSQSLCLSVLPFTLSFRTTKKPAYSG